MGAVGRLVVAALEDTADGDRSPVDQRFMEGGGGVPGIPGEAVVVVLAAEAAATAVVVSALTDRVSILG